MTIRIPGPALGLTLVMAGLAACSGAPVPNTYAAMSQGVGFGDYQRHLQAQETARRAAIPYSIPPETRSAPVPGAAGSAVTPGAPGAPMVTIASQPLPVTPLPGAPMPVTPLPAAPVAVIPAAAAPGAGMTTQDRPDGVTDTTSFRPVPFGQRPAGAEVAPQGTTQMVQVTSVPTGATSAPNVMAYALQTRHAVGTAVHRRTNPLRWSRWERACLQFASQDLAQEAFLAAGGPDRDPNHLDPDGDGFACWWDPQIYRRAAALSAPVAGESLDITD
jgi:hypothetical protein